jgi:HSP20 family protein
MGKRIKPISRTVRIETELTRIAGEVFSQPRRVSWLTESWVPCVDVSEGEADIVIEVELPGISREEITILVGTSRIEIRGAKREIQPEEKFKYIRLEREYGPFRRQITLPGPIIPEKANAVLEDGILVLRLRKYRRARKKQVIVPIRKAGD